MSLQEYSHRRKNLLTGEWVLVSPHRTQRPWQGQIETDESSELAEYEPDCYLCPGNSRAGGVSNPDYRGPYAFDNDYPALSTHSLSGPTSSDLFVSEAESGVCRVVCYAEQHNLYLADMPADIAVRALKFLRDEFMELDARADIGYVQVFENRGQMMGCSNAHPHAQIWATRGLPNEPDKEAATQQAHYAKTHSPLLIDYLAAEIQSRQRLVLQNREAVSLVPFWAVWPFETLVIPCRPVDGLEAMTDSDLVAFTEVLQGTLQCYNRLFQTQVPYSLGYHSRPGDGLPHPEWQFHAHIYPPLLRSATVRKHLVGFEMLGMPQRDLTPESAAAKLRESIE